MKRLRSTQITHPPGAFSKWMILKHPFPGRAHRVTCCDCGSVHDIQARAYAVVRKNGKIVEYSPLSLREVVVMERVRKNERTTAARRRAAKHAKVRKALARGK